MLKLKLQFFYLDTTSIWDDIFIFYWLTWLKNLCKFKVIHYRLYYSVPQIKPTMSNKSESLFATDFSAWSILVSSTITHTTASVRNLRVIFGPSYSYTNCQSPKFCLYVPSKEVYLNYIQPSSILSEYTHFPRQDISNDLLMIFYTLIFFSFKVFFNLSSCGPIPVVKTDIQ